MSATDSQILSVIQYCWEILHPTNNDAAVGFCCEVTHQLRDLGWEVDAGLVAKSLGQEGGTGADGQRYACDAIWVQRPSRSADIIGSWGGDSPYPTLYWYSNEQLPPQSSYRVPYGSRQLPLYGGGDPPDPPDPPTPACAFQPTDLTPILDRLTQLEEQHAFLLAEIRRGGWPVRLSNGWLTLSGVVGPKP